MLKYQSFGVVQTNFLQYSTQSGHVPSLRRHQQQTCRNSSFSLVKEANPKNPSKSDSHEICHAILLFCDLTETVYSSWFLSWSSSLAQLMKLCSLLAAVISYKSRSVEVTQHFWKIRSLLFRNLHVDSETQLQAHEYENTPVLLRNVFCTMFCCLKHSPFLKKHHLSPNEH